MMLHDAHAVCNATATASGVHPQPIQEVRGGRAQMHGAVVHRTGSHCQGTLCSPKCALPCLTEAAAKLLSCLSIQGLDCRVAAGNCPRQSGWLGPADSIEAGQASLAVKRVPPTPHPSHTTLGLSPSTPFLELAGPRTCRHKAPPRPSRPSRTERASDPRGRGGGGSRRSPGGGPPDQSPPGRYQLQLLGQDCGRCGPGSSSGSLGAWTGWRRWRRCWSMPCWWHCWPYQRWPSAGCSYGAWPCAGGTTKKPSWPAASLLAVVTRCPPRTHLYMQGSGAKVPEHGPRPVSDGTTAGAGSSAAAGYLRQVSRCSPALGRF